MSSGPANYTTYAGDANQFRLSRIITDASGATYVVGSRLFTTQFGTAGDVFLTKLDPSGNVVFTASLGGKGDDRPNDIVLDSEGNIYIAGNTSSPNFPLRNPIQNAVGRGAGFLLKLNPDGSRLIYSTYFGAPGGLTELFGLAVDSTQAVYVTGATYAPDFPATTAWPGKIPSFPISSGAIIAKIAPAGDRIVYADLVVGTTVACGAGSSCFTSTRNTAGIAIAVDAAGNATIAGNTNTTDLPTTAGSLRRQGIGAFAAKVSADGASLMYLTYLGAANYVFSPLANPGNIVNGIAVDPAGNAYLVGSTNDPDFPATPGAFQASFSIQGTLPSYPPPPKDAFAAKLSPDGRTMVWATYLGDEAEQSGTSIALDALGNVWVAGTTASAAFPQTSTGWPQSGDFVLALDPQGSALRYAARYPSGTAAQGIAVGAAGLLHLAGAAGMVSAFSPGQPPAMRLYGLGNAASGELTGRIAPGEVISIYGSGIGPVIPAQSTLDAAGRVTTTLEGVQVLFDDQPAPMLYASGAQINAVVPFGVAQRSTVRVRVMYGGAEISLDPVYVVPAIPEIFKRPDGTAAALNEDGTVNSHENPAKPGSVITVWISGAGAIDGLTDGEVPMQGKNLYCCEARAGADAEVLYGGIAPGMVAGVMQVNLRLPRADVANPVAVALTVLAAGRTSVPATVWVYGSPVHP